MKRSFSIVKSEAFSAYLLLPVAILAIALGQHVNGENLISQSNFIGIHLSISEFVLQYLLAIFFFKIGLELRHELIEGVLRDRKILGISALSAVWGMVLPVAIFFSMTGALNISNHGWGTIMATDLPLVLALLTIIKRKNLQAFILALATLDDIGSIIVLSLIQKTKAHWMYLLIFVLFFVAYSQISRHFPSVSILLLLFVVGIIIGNKAGIPVSLSAVLFGVFTLGNHQTQPTIETRLLRFLEPISAYLVIPVFLFVVLFRKFNISGAASVGGLLIALIFARLLGKPLGIYAGMALGQKILKSELPFSKSERWLVGLLGTLGLSVSLIFAQGQLSGDLLNTGILAVLITVPLGASATIIYSRNINKENKHS